MSYELLRGLYLGLQSNADLSDTDSRERLHVRTTLDAFIPTVLRGGRDVVLTGNPGDGKSHLVRFLHDNGLLGGAQIELDLSARDSKAVAREWAALKTEGRPLVICANEGPLTDLIDVLEAEEATRGGAAELRAQLGRLVVSHPADLPEEPQQTVLINLADRNLLTEDMVGAALKRVCNHQFLPSGILSTETPAGQNITLLADPDVRDRLAALLAAVGRRLEGHVTFRQLWATISYAITAGKQSSSQRGTPAGLGTYPLDFLASGRADISLIKVFRRHFDPANVPDPQLDEDLWEEGEPRRGRWLFDLDDEPEPPAELWRVGKRAEALALLASLKRLVALAHTEGEHLLELLKGASHDLPLELEPEDLLERVLSGVRRTYLSPAEDADAPDWLTGGLPLWIGHTYQDISAGQRPHVAAAWIDAADLEVRYPLRPHWLQVPMGTVSELAWLHHVPSGVSLRLEPRLLQALRIAETSSGPLEPPEPVQRFLARLAGWAERQPRQPDVQFAVLERPRGVLTAHGHVHDREQGGAHYAR
jgi:hypothetical protein